MKINDFYILIYLFLFINCDVNESSFWENVELNKGQVYLIYRGTNSKQGFFARDFNIKDTLSSHVGILLHNKSNWYVYNVSDFKDDSSDYKKQKIEDFFDFKKENIFYASLWKIEGLDSLKQKQLRMELKELEKVNIKFDKSFSLNDSTRLYCSEFVLKILKNIDSVKFNFKTHKRKLTGVYKTYFRKDTLEYYPVDVFQNNKNILKIKEWHFK